MHSSGGHDKRLSTTMCVSVGNKMQEMFSLRKVEDNFSSTQGLAQEIDHSLKGYSRAADEKRNTVFFHHWSILPI